MEPSHPGRPVPRRNPPPSAYKATHPDLLSLPRSVRAPSQPQLQVGDRIAARYRLREQLDHLGDPLTFLAVDEKTLADVRVQVAVADSNRITRITRFLHRAQRLKRFDHPNVARLVDVGSWQGVYYCVEEWLPGRTLAELLSWGPLPLEHSLSIGRQVAGALAAAHERGVDHGALNPNRVLIIGTAVAKVTSFALLKRALVGPAEPGEAVQVTAPGYTAPERVAGLPAVARAEDAWGLGALLFEMLTGRPPADRSRPTAVPPISQVDPDLPPALGALVDRLLARRADDRSVELAEVGVSLLELEESLRRMGALT